MRIKNWRKFQHYKHRNPPWIRLHRGLLNDRQWFDLDPKAAKFLVNLWLIASESDDGLLPSIADIAWRLRIPESQAKSLVSELSHWLEHGASEPLADCKQDSPTETETETEKSRASASGILQTVLDGERTLAVIEHRRRKRAPLTPHTATLLVKQLSKWPDPNAAADEMMLRGWTGFKAEWMVNGKGQGPPMPAGTYPKKTYREIVAERNSKQTSEH